MNGRGGLFQNKKTIQKLGEAAFHTNPKYTPKEQREVLPYIEEMPTQVPTQSPL